MKILFLRNFTVEPLEPQLVTAFGEEQLEITYGGYGSVIEDSMALLDKENNNKFDFVVLALSLDHFASSIYSREWSSDSAQEELGNIYNLLMQRSPCPIICNNFIPPAEIFLHIPTSDSLAGRAEAVKEINLFVRSFVRENSSVFSLVDWEKLALQIGTRHAIDPRFALMMKAPFRPVFLERYASEIKRVIDSSRRGTKKVLITDADNTLWGGIVGEDGIDGLKLDLYDYPGICFSQYQFDLLTLKDQGVLLCICSKNNEDDLWEVFDKHPGMLLKKDDFTAWKINWYDKAANIEALSKELNLGLDSFVFVDDNPAECERVKTAYPDVTVLERPSELYEFPGFVFRQQLFDRLTLTKEDQLRSELYQTERKRSEKRTEYKTEAEFLKAMEITVVIHPMLEAELSRTSQLTQRTNQFNTTTKRYAETEIKNLASAEDSKVFTLAVSDKFGPLGLVGVAIFCLEKERVVVDSFLMSCRIIGRQIEDAFFAEALSKLPEIWKTKPFAANYLPTKKNSQVSELWSRFGFKESLKQADGTQYSGNFSDLTAAVPEFIVCGENE